MVPLHRRTLLRLLRISKHFLHDYTRAPACIFYSALGCSDFLSPIDSVETGSFRMQPRAALSDVPSADPGIMYLVRRWHDKALCDLLENPVVSASTVLPAHLAAYW